MFGQCLCGEVQFEISGEIPNLYQCHCKLCRKQGGSSANAATIIDKDQFSWRSGEESISHYKKTTGFSSDFCSICGSPVPNKLRDSHLIWVPAGLLENDEKFKVVAHIYTQSKANWDDISSSAKLFDEMPSLDDFHEILLRKS